VLAVLFERQLAIWTRSSTARRDTASKE
jgi:hypothetical protein